MKILELTLTHRTPKGEVITYDKIEANDLTKLVCQFVMVMAQIAEQIRENELASLRLKEGDNGYDDCPF